MWILRLALRRPYTFVVAAMLIAILGLVMMLRTPTDIFPEINIPVISMIFNYTGMSADDMQSRIVTGYERILTTTVNDIEHIESQSLNGISVTEISFQPNAKIEEAIAQVTAISQTAIRFMPPRDGGNSRGLPPVRYPRQPDDRPFPSDNRLSEDSVR